MEIMLCRAAPHEKDMLFRLLQYSLYEESRTDGNAIGEDGLFAYPWFDAYFSDPEREAYLIREWSAKTLVGFCMINTHTRLGHAGHSIAEFMILPGCRRQGAGIQAAVQCFQKHGGYWEASPSRGSEAAYAFWEKAIGTYTDGRFGWTEETFFFTHNAAVSNTDSEG